MNARRAFLIAGVFAVVVQAAVAQSRPAGRGSSPPRPDHFASAAIIPLKGEITDVTRTSLERRMGQARQAGAPLIIIELDTPGGMLTSTLDMCYLIKKTRDEGIAVYAWVNGVAYSAGTIIALATDGVVMSPNATMGDCQPIMIGPQGAGAVPADMEAKNISPLLEELRDSARRNGYDMDLIDALVRPEVQVFWVHNKLTGEKQFVDARGRDELFGWASPGQKAKPSDPEIADRVEPVSDQASKTQWRYLKEVDELGEIRQPIDGARELLTMRDRRAALLGFSLGTVGSDAELGRFFGVQGQVQRLDLNPAEWLIEWLASPTVRAILFLIMLLGAYTEFHTPGFGVAGAVAIIALAVFLGAPYLAGFTVTWEVVLIIVGLILLKLEIFVIPGFGVTGILGIILLVIGLIASFVPAEPGYQREWYRMPLLPGTYTYLVHGIYALTFGTVGGLVGMYMLAKHLPRAPLARRLIGVNPVHDEVVVDYYEGPGRVGDLGTSESLLRPAGKARFGGELVDVVSQGEYIPGGVPVRVIERCGNRIVVERAVEGAGTGER